jgi:hypothetical protein
MSSVMSGKNGERGSSVLAVPRNAGLVIEPALSRRRGRRLTIVISHNDRIDASPLNFKRRHQTMGRFKSAGQAQRFLAAHGPVIIVFSPNRNALSARSFRHYLTDAVSLRADDAANLVD